MASQAVVSAVAASPVASQPRGATAGRASGFLSGGVKVPRRSAFARTNAKPVRAVTRAAAEVRHSSHRPLRAVAGARHRRCREPRPQGSAVCSIWMDRKAERGRPADPTEPPAASLFLIAAARNAHGERVSPRAAPRARSNPPERACPRALARRPPPFPRKPLHSKLRGDSIFSRFVRDRDGSIDARSLTSLRKSSRPRENTGRLATQPLRVREGDGPARAAADGAGRRAPRGVCRGCRRRSRHRRGRRRQGGRQRRQSRAHRRSGRRRGGGCGHRGQEARLRRAQGAVERHDEPRPRHHHQERG